MNPKLVQDATNLRNVNGNKTNIFTTVNNPDGTPVKDENGNPVKVNNLDKQATSDYLDDYGDFLREIYKVDSPETIANTINTQAVKDAQEKANSYETELNAIDKDIDAIEKDVEKELSGSGATGSRARIEKIARKEALQTEYNSVLKSYTMYYNKANDLIKTNTEAYKTSQEQRNKLNTALANGAGAKYASDIALDLSQAQFDQKLAQQAQLTNDPATAIGGIIKQFADLGIVGDRDLAWHVAEQKRLGMTLPQYTQKMIQDFKSKPEYQQALAKKANE